MSTGSSLYRGAKRLWGLRQVLVASMYGAHAALLGCSVLVCFGCASEERGTGAAGVEVGGGRCDGGGCLDAATGESRVPDVMADASGGRNERDSYAEIDCTPSVNGGCHCGCNQERTERICICGYPANIAGPCGPNGVCDDGFVCQWADIQNGVPGACVYADAGGAVDAATD